MKKQLLLFSIYLSFILLLNSCLYSEYDSSKEQKMRWTYLEIKTEMTNDTTSSYLYGQVKESVINKIKRNENAKGIFFVENTRYINDDDLLQLYEDRNDKGTLAYRIEHIQKIEFFKRDPILFFDKKQLDASAIRFLKEKTK